MRWLKFRVWYKRYPRPIEGEMRYFNQSNDGFPLACKTYQTDNWMQFTGLLDMWEKEIYEGDIVMYVDDSYIKRKGEVVFINGSFAIKSDYITSYRLTNYSIEVIGNIYENQELL